MSRLYDELDLKRALRAKVREAGSQARASTELNITQQYISDVLQGEKHPGRKLASALGFEPVTRYVRSDPSRGGLP